MKLFIHLSCISQNVAGVFRKDGWNLTGEGGGRLLAEHSQVDNEDSARERLNHMGFLVSRTLAIEFEERPMSQKRPDKGYVSDFAM
jgi:hypothetical protein